MVVQAEILSDVSSLIDSFQKAFDVNPWGKGHPLQIEYYDDVTRVVKECVDAIDEDTFLRELGNIKSGMRRVVHSGRAIADKEQMIVIDVLLARTLEIARRGHGIVGTGDVDGVMDETQKEVGGVLRSKKKMGGGWKRIELAGDGYYTYFPVLPNPPREISPGV